MADSLRALNVAKLKLLFNDLRAKCQFHVRNHGYNKNSLVVPATVDWRDVRAARCARDRCLQATYLMVASTR